MQASTYFAGTGQYGVNNRATLLGLATTVPLCLLLVPRLGIVGAALSMSASYAAGVLYLTGRYRRAIEAEWNDLLPGWEDVRGVALRLMRNEE
jgi:O-antigen/teichoic acid export membrane protein